MKKRYKQLKIKEFRVKLSTEKDAEKVLSFLERVIERTLDKDLSMGMGLNKKKKLVWVRI